VCQKIGLVDDIENQGEHKEQNEKGSTTFKNIFNDFKREGLTKESVQRQICQQNIKWHKQRKFGNPI